MNEDYGKITTRKNLYYNRSFYPVTSPLAQKLFYYVVGVGHFICQPSFYLHRYEYNNILIKYTLDGQGMLKYRGKTYTLRPGQLFIIKCFDMHEYRTYDSPKWENKWVHANGCLIDEYFNRIYEHCGPVITMPPDNQIEQKIDRLMSLIESGDPHGEPRSSVILLDILTEIFEQIPVEAIGAGQRGDHAIDTALTYIENNYFGEIDLADIAKASNYSLSHFIRRFRQVTKLSPYQYLRQYRVNRSKTLLTTTDRALSAIAEQVGFTNVNSYIRNFQAFEGMSPTEYRALCSQNDQNDPLYKGESKLYEVRDKMANGTGEGVPGRGTDGENG